MTIPHPLFVAETVAPLFVLTKASKQVTLLTNTAGDNDAVSQYGQYWQLGDLGKICGPNVDCCNVSNCLKTAKY